MLRFKVIKEVSLCKFYRIIIKSKLIIKESYLNSEDLFMSNVIA